MTKSCTKTPETCEEVRERRLREVLWKMEPFTNMERKEIADSAWKIWKLDPGMRELRMKTKVKAGKAEGTGEMKELENGESYSNSVNEPDCNAERHWVSGFSREQKPLLIRRIVGQWPEKDR